MRPRTSKITPALPPAPAKKPTSTLADMAAAYRHLIETPGQWSARVGDAVRGNDGNLRAALTFLNHLHGPRTFGLRADPDGALWLILYMQPVDTRESSG
jgi:hypothetical protein